MRAIDTNIPRPHDGPATPDAIAGLRAHPQFADAMRASNAGLVSLYQGSHLLNWLMDDRARLVFGYFALSLHFSRDPAVPSSGLTPTRMKSICVDLDICSPGRAAAMLSLMRFGGYLEKAPATGDLRQRPLVATDKLIALIAERQRVHFSAMAPLFPDGSALLQALDRPAFMSGLLTAMARHYQAGFRIVAASPGLELFGDRNAGMLILASLLIAGEADDTMPPRRPVPISISAMARRFKVSRPHVLKLVREAEADGLIERTGEQGERVLITPRLADGAQNLYATLYLFLAACGREAMRAGAGD
jgi:DNA-binding MarR family transcriptional regulator